MSFDRDELIRIIADTARSEPQILGLWEGGSAAFGRLDALSDADLHVVAAAGQVECAIAAMRRALSDRWSIAREYQRAYEGKAEFFWQLDGAPPLNFVDMVFEDCPQEASRSTEAITLLRWFTSTNPIALRYGASRRTSGAHASRSG